jgi:hypothetical protein
VTAAEIEELTIAPTELILSEGDQVQLQAIGRFSNGVRGNLTQQAHWRTSNANIVQMETLGIVEAVGIGETTITAHYEELDSEEIAVTVLPFVENGKPDLIVENINYSEAENTIVTATIVNQGSVRSTGFLVSAFVRDEAPDYSDLGDDFSRIEYLGPNHGTTVQFELELFGNDTIWVYTDTNNQIQESHEYNNAKMLVVE